MLIVILIKRMFQLTCTYIKIMRKHKVINRLIIHKNFGCTCLTWLCDFTLGQNQENYANRWRSWKSCTSGANYNLYPFQNANKNSIYYNSYCYSLLLMISSLTVRIPRTLELFVHSLLTKTMQITSAKNAKTLSPSHMWVTFCERLF